MMRRQQDHQQSRIFCELSALIFNILRSPPTLNHFSDLPASPAAVSSSRRPSGAVSSLPKITLPGFASLLLGVSVALMLCGSVTFFIGFILMPWVIGLVMFFYFLGIVSSLSMLGLAIPCHTTMSYLTSPRKGPFGPAAWKLG